MSVKVLRTATYNDRNTPWRKSRRTPATRHEKSHGTARNTSKTTTATNGHYISCWGATSARSFPMRVITNGSNGGDGSAIPSETLNPPSPTPRDNITATRRPMTPTRDIATKNKAGKTRPRCGIYIMPAFLHSSLLDGCRIKPDGVLTKPSETTSHTLREGLSPPPPLVDTNRVLRSQMAVTPSERLLGTGIAIVIAVDISDMAMAETHPETTTVAEPLLGEKTRPR